MAISMTLLARPSRPFAGRRALVVSPVPTHPTTHGNRARVLHLIRFLRALGFDVHVAIWHSGVDQDCAAMQAEFGDRYHPLPYRKPPQRRESALGRWGRRLRQLVNTDARYTEGIDDWYDDSADPILQELDSTVGFDIAVVEYVFVSRALLVLKSPKLKLIDTHDVFANRHRILLAAGMTPQFFSTTPQEERRGLLRADLVLGIQAAETALLGAYQGVAAMTFGHTVALTNLWGTKPLTWDVLMVGSRNQMNVEGLLWFGTQVMPLLLQAMPAVRVAVAGGVCASTPDFVGVTKLGVVPDLETVYACTGLVVNPVRSGTGLNIKSVEALGFGMPLLSTESGCRGLDQARGQGCLVADSPADFAEAAARLLASGGELARMSQAAHAFAERWNNEQTQSLVARLAARLHISASNPST
jgi:hypothetical protein